MTTIEVPVRMVIQTEQLEAALVEILRKDGSLLVALCPLCFALVPASKIDDHFKAAQHA